MSRKIQSRDSYQWQNEGRQHSLMYNFTLKLEGKKCALSFLLLKFQEEPEEFKKYQEKSLFQFHSAHKTFCDNI